MLEFYSVHSGRIGSDHRCHSLADARNSPRVTTPSRTRDALLSAGTARRLRDCADGRAATARGAAAAAAGAADAAQRGAAAAADQPVRAFRCRIGRVTRMVARARRAPSARMRRVSAAIRTIVPAGRTESRFAARNSVATASRPTVAFRRRPRRAPPRAHVGRARTRRPSCCCTAGWMSARRSSFSSTRWRAIGT